MLLVAATLLFLRVHSAVAVDSCELYTNVQYPQGVEYQYDCTAVAHDLRTFALCLLQRNTLNAVMGCTEQSANQLIWWPVHPPGGPGDDMDLIPSDMSDKFRVDNDNDGKLMVTPRGILLASSWFPSCQKCNIRAALQLCPQQDIQQFRKCLCCQKVLPETMTCFENCIHETEYGHFDQSDLFKRINWTCDSYCARRTKNKSLVGSQKSDEIDSDSTNSTSPACDMEIFRVVDGKVVEDCDGNDSFGETITLETTTMAWSKVDEATASLAPPSASSILNAQATGTASANGAALRSDLGSSPPTQTAISPSPPSQTASRGDGRIGVPKIALSLSLLLCMGYALCM